MKILAVSYVIGPLLWIVFTIWCSGRQATASALGLGYFVAAISAQIVLISSPFVIHHLSVAEAGLTGFSGCPNSQEYCDEFYKFEALRDRKLFHLGAVFWIGNAVWNSGFYASSRLRARTT